jgi:hypothetical protein
MQHFDIRILKADGTTSISATALYINAEAAIAAARRMAKAQRFEVWQGGDYCVYAGVSLSSVPAADSSPP